MASVRTQIYLTDLQRARLEEIRRRDGKSLAEVVREAVDAYTEATGANVQDALDATYGTMPDLEVPSRDGWDRGYG